MATSEFPFFFSSFWKLFLETKLDYLQMFSRLSDYVYLKKEEIGSFWKPKNLSY